MGPSPIHGEGNGTPLQYSCLENPMDGGAWWAAVHGVAKSRTRLRQLHFHFPLSCIGEGNGKPLQCSCLENPRDRGAWWAAVYGVAQSQTRLKRFSKRTAIQGHKYRCSRAHASNSREGSRAESRYINTQWVAPRITRERWEHSGAKNQLQFIAPMQEADPTLAAAPTFQENLVF